MDKKSSRNGQKEKRLPRKSKTDASKQNEKPTLNKSFYALNNRLAIQNVAWPFVKEFLNMAKLKHISYSEDFNFTGRVTTFP
jgi:hypothetical protein